MLPFSPESVVFQFAIQKYKEYKIQNNNLPVIVNRCASWSLTMMEELSCGCLRTGCLGDIWALEGQRNRNLEITE
jgi:hypothetical protein